MEQLLLDIWESVYITTIDIFNFLLYQAWFVLGLVILLAAAKVFEWRAKNKKSFQDKGR